MFKRKNANKTAEKPVEEKAPSYEGLVGDNKEEQPKVEEPPQQTLTEKEVLEKRLEELKQEEKNLQEQQQAVENQNTEQRVVLKPIVVSTEEMFNHLSDRIGNLEVGLKEIVDYLRSK